MPCPSPVSGGVVPELGGGLGSTTTTHPQPSLSIIKPLLTKNATFQQQSPPLGQEFLLSGVKVAWFLGEAFLTGPGKGGPNLIEALLRPPSGMASSHSPARLKVTQWDGIRGEMNALPFPVCRGR